MSIPHPSKAVLWKGEKMLMRQLADSSKPMKNGDSHNCDGNWIPNPSPLSCLL